MTETNEPKGTLPKLSTDPVKPSPGTSAPKDKFWIYDISVLANRDFVTKMFPRDDMTSTEKYNAITRFVLVATILGYIVTKNSNIILTGLVTIAAVAVLNHMANDRTKMPTEGFATNLAIATARAKSIDPNQFTLPTPENPAMNVMPADIYEKPGRLPAAHAADPLISKKIADSVKELHVRGMRESNEDKDPKLDPRLYQDIEDQREFDHSMRSFQPTANTQIPNEQDKFAQFLYGDMVSCKAGDSIACMRANTRHTNY